MGQSCSFGQQPGVNASTGQPVCMNIGPLQALAETSIPVGGGMVINGFEAAIALILLGLVVWGISHG